MHSKISMVKYDMIEECNDSTDTVLQSHKVGYSYFWDPYSQLKLADVVNETDLRRRVDTLFPPKILLINNKKHVQRVSAAPAGEADITRMIEEFQRLKLCYSRTSDPQFAKENYIPLLDEIVRQLAIEMPGRATLLLKVRDELFHSLEAHEELFRSSILFTQRSEMLAIEGLKELRDECDKLDEEDRELELKLQLADKELHKTRRVYKEKEQLENTKNERELRFYNDKMVIYEELLKQLEISATHSYDRNADKIQN